MLSVGGKEGGNYRTEYNTLIYTNGLHTAIVTQIHNYTFIFIRVVKKLYEHDASSLLCAAIM